MSPSKQSRCQFAVVLCVVFHTVLLEAAWILLRHSGFDIVVVCQAASNAEDTLKSDLSVQTETHL